MSRRRTARIQSGALEGIEGIGVVAEVDISRGLPGFHLVGLPNAEVRESRERVLSALRNSGQKVPLGKITVNLAPAAMRKTGASCDLAIALGVLAAGRVIGLGPAARMGATYLGELSLFGEVRPVPGLLSMAIAAAAAGARTVVVPVEQVTEARLVSGLAVVGVQTLSQAIDWWRGNSAPPVPRHIPGSVEREPLRDSPAPWGDLAGQPLVRKGAVVAAVGRHHCLMIGPPGTGKTRLARLLSRAGPPLTGPEALEVTRIYSAVGLRPSNPRRQLVAERPFRAPHHSVTRAGLIGGGANLRPGEVTLAHQGILFLDEISEFSPQVLDGLREPLADACVTVARGTGARSYPARFQLVAAMNPCRCGYLGSTVRRCTCSATEIGRHRSRLSGPLLDRIDLVLEVGEWQGEFLTRSREQAVPKTRDTGWRENPNLAGLAQARVLLQEWRQAPLVDRLSQPAARFLDEVRQPLGLSLRGIERCVSVAATLATLDGESHISPEHTREALEFRLDLNGE